MVENVKVTGTKKENKILAWAKKHKTGLLVAAGSIAGVATVGTVGYASYNFGKRQTQSMPIVELTGDLIEEIKRGHELAYAGNESCVLVPTSEVNLSGYSNPVVTIDVNGISVGELLDRPIDGQEIFDDALKECFKETNAEPVLILDTLLYD